MSHQLLTQLAAARSALEFYAEPKRYEGANQRPIPNDPHAPRGAVYVHDVTRDGGDIARAALSTLAQEPAGQSEAGRKEAAKIIDPNCFWDAGAPNSFQQKKMDRALAKADAILALLPAVSPSPGGTGGPSEALEIWQVELDEIIGHLGAAVIQSTDRDDRIIMDHVNAAHEIAKIVRRKA